MTEFGTMLTALLVSLAGFVALWPVSLRRHDASVVDFWWGPGFLAQVLVVAALTPEIDLRGAAILTLIGVWALRMGWVLGSRRLREGHEDPRYTALRSAWDPGFWWKSLFLVFILQALVQWLVALGPMAGLMAPGVAIGMVGIVGILVSVAGLALETLADAELDRFRRTAPPGALCETGLRAHLRHPNYAGEILFWIGVSLLVVEAGVWLGLLSPVLVTLLLVRVSGAPMLDERLTATRPGYAAYRARVPGFVPRLSRLRRPAG